MEMSRIDLPEYKAEALEACLSQIEAGKSLEEALLPHGTLAEELRPLLEAALASRAYAASLAAPIGSLARSRARFLIAAQAKSERSRKGWLGGIAFTRLGFAALAFLLVLLVGSFSTAVASAQALPGDLLYPVKLASEQTRLIFADDPIIRLTLEKTFDERRAQEIQELLRRDRSEVVRLGGEVSDIQPDQWVVRDTRVLFDANTQLDGAIDVGFYVEVTGRLNPDASLLAQTVRARQITFSGTVDTVENEVWVIDGLPVKVTGHTRWSGSPEVGSQVAVNTFVLADGSLQASLIQIGTANEAVVTWTSQPIVEEKPGHTPTPAAQKIESSSDDNGGKEDRQLDDIDEDGGENSGGEDSGSDDHSGEDGDDNSGSDGGDDGDDEDGGDDHGD